MLLQLIYSVKVADVSCIKNHFALKLIHVFTDLIVADHNNDHIDIIKERIGWKD